MYIFIYKPADYEYVIITLLKHVVKHFYLFKVGDISIIHGREIGVIITMCWFDSMFL